MREGLRRWGAFQRTATVIAGKGSLAFAGTVTVLLGGSVYALATWLAGVSWLLSVLVTLACVFAFYTVGAYQVWEKADRRAQDAESALAEAEANPGPSAPGVTFWDVGSGTLAGNDIVNNYNAPPLGVETPNWKLINVGGATFTGNELTIEFGDGPPPELPRPRPSTPEERASLRDQLLDLAVGVEAVMAPWGQSRQVVAMQMGIPAEEFMARQPEIVAERERITDEVTARYNAEYRSAVVQAYGHVRSIGFGDLEMERYWHSRLGVVASR
ncbi:MAG TPA: hypothetical protein VK784_00175, partial [Pseudonocardiaceae bacterium]|nr:hypothetical protein [Pseudonocardiaceae bacterium]